MAGSYSRHGDTLRLQAQIVDVNTGAVERTLDPVVGDVSAPNSAIERLRDEVATALEASAARNSMGSIGHLPTLPAYREFADAFGVGVEGPQALPHLIKATQLDTTFTLAMYWLAVAFAEHQQWKAADSVVQILASRRDGFTPVERELFASIDGFAHSDFARDLVASRALFKRDSTIRAAGGVAGDALSVNRPREVLTVFGSPSPSRSRVASMGYGQESRSPITCSETSRRRWRSATAGRARSQCAGRSGVHAGCADPSPCRTRRHGSSAAEGRQLDRRVESRTAQGDARTIQRSAESGRNL